MSLLSKAEVQFLQGQKLVSKSYEYKLKSIIKRKISKLIEKELPLLSGSFPTQDLTKFSKNQNMDRELQDLTKNSKMNIKNHYSDDFIDDEKIIHFNRQYPIKNHNKPSCTKEEENNEQLYIKSRKKINNCNTRAGGLAWLRYRLDMAGVVGSNPTRPIRKFSHSE